MPEHNFKLMKSVLDQDDRTMRVLAGRAIHRPSDMGMREVADLAMAVIILLDTRNGDGQTDKRWLPSIQTVETTAEGAIIPPKRSSPPLP